MSIPGTHFGANSNFGSDNFPGPSFLSISPKTIFWSSAMIEYTERHMLDYRTLPFNIKLPASLLVFTEDSGVVPQPEGLGTTNCWDNSCTAPKLNPRCYFLRITAALLFYSRLHLPLKHTVCICGQKCLLAKRQKIVERLLKSSIALSTIEAVNFVKRLRTWISEILLRKIFIIDIWNLCCCCWAFSRFDTHSSHINNRLQ